MYAGKAGGIANKGEDGNPQYYIVFIIKPRKSVEHSTRHSYSGKLTTH